MIDLRCHILDGTQYGPNSFAESLEMCRMAIDDGVRTVVATPRWQAGRVEPPIPFEECRLKLSRLGEELRGALSFEQGFVLEFSPELPELVGRYGSKLALAGKRHLLVSLPSLEVPSNVEVVWKALACRGFSVLLSHPECNAVLRRDEPRLKRWIAEGLMLQFDAASITGSYGREVSRFALGCLRKYEGSVVVASNIRWGAEQEISLRKAHKVLASQIGGLQANMFVNQTPSMLLGIDDLGEKVRARNSRGLISLLRSFGSIKALRGSA